MRRMSAQRSVYRAVQGGSKHGRCTFGIFHEDCYARSLPRFVCNNFHHYLLLAVIAQMVRGWAMDPRVVQSVGSRPLGNQFTFYLNLLNFYQR